MQNFYYKFWSLLLLVAILRPAQAQISSGGYPMSLRAAFKADYEKTSDLKATVLPAFPLQKILKEDQAYNGIRFAAPIAVDLGLDNAGTWTDLQNGDRLWRLNIKSSGAVALAALYDDLYLPPGASLYMYNESGSEILGAYTHESNTSNFTFLTGFIAGETAVIEYFEPKAVRGQGTLHIFRIDHAYKKSVFEEKSAQNVLNDFGFGASVACNVNINCQEGTKWQDQKRGICRVIVVVQEGSGFCTGNLINNTQNDGTPYILSAFHCQDGFTPMYDFWRFDFNYEAPTCSNASLEPTRQSMLGSTLRASRRQNDFLLLELNDTIPSGYNVYYNGWDRRNQPPTSSFSIHHPKGDIKKIAVENSTASIHSQNFQWLRGDGTLLYSTPQNHMFRVQFDASTVEVGSSGAALFDGNGRIVGQLHGGIDLGSCTLNEAFFDRFTLSWEGGGTPETRLKDWLDPENTGATSLNGLEILNETMSGLSGFVRTLENEGVAGVTVILDGTVKATTTTDTAGAYRFSNLPPAGSYTVSLAKDFNDINGVNILDVTVGSKHILGIEPLDHPLKLLAADVNNSKNVSVLDLIAIRKLILGIDPAFTESPSWRFVPADFEFFEPESPWDEFIPSRFTVPKLSNALLNFNFTGYKTGDLNLSANPKN